MRAVVEDPAADLHVPAVCDVEVTSALRRLVLGRRVSPRRAQDALAAYLDLPVLRHAHEPLLLRVLQLRDNFGAYDATYVALAELLGARLMTADQGLARAARSQTQLIVLEA